MSLPRTGLGIRALMAEAATGLVMRPGRSILTALGTVLGVGALVTILGLTSTAQGQISERFNLLEATQVTVEQAEGAALTYTAGDPYNAFPTDAGQRVKAITGVTNAGVWWSVDEAAAGTTSSLPPGAAAAGQRVPVYAVDPGALAATGPSWTLGTGYNAFHQARGERVAILGPTTAQQLGISRLDSQPAVFVGGVDFTIVGVLDDVKRNPDLLTAIIVPTTTAEQTWGLPAKTTPSMLIETALGAAPVVGDQVALALRPDDPSVFRVLAPQPPGTLRDSVAADLNGLFLALAAVSLLIGTFGIANTTLVSVLERIGEIGLRRALGARPRDVALQFLAESAALGTIGGILGTTLGIGAVLAVAINQQWSAIMPTWLAAAPIVGTITGLLAGLYPAWRATRVEPADALRR